MSTENKNEEFQYPTLGLLKGLGKPKPARIEGPWKNPVIVAENHFKNKSLSNWAVNIAIGCEHGCRFCYVPEVSTRKLKAKLEPLGVKDPDSEWGNYIFLRHFDEDHFIRTAKKADATPMEKRQRDGNSAVMLCTTTDPYQSFRDKALNIERARIVRRILEILLMETDLNVRILTRSPLARQDFDVMKAFGNRLLFGMSLPTLSDKLSRIYEPHAPGPAARLRTLQEARKQGLNVFVAMAPTFPEMTMRDFRDVMVAIADLDPVTLYHEPINIRAENVARIAAAGAAEKIKMRTDVFETPFKWATYSLEQHRYVEELADIIETKAGPVLLKCLHLWPDQDLKKFADANWLAKWHSRVSEWPK
jgi:DNA repair photolyase